MVPESAIPEEEPVEVRVRNLAIGVREVHTEMARVQLELNLNIIELQLKAQPSTLLEVKEQRATAVTEAIAAVNSEVVDCTQLFEQSFKVLTSLQGDSNVQRLETEA